MNYLKIEARNVKYFRHIAMLKIDGCVTVLHGGENFAADSSVQQDLNQN